MKDEKQVIHAIKRYYQLTDIKMNDESRISSTIGRKYSIAENTYRTLITSFLVNTIINASNEGIVNELDDLLNYFTSDHNRDYYFPYEMVNNMRIGLLTSKHDYAGSSLSLSQDEVEKFKRLYQDYMKLIGHDRTGWICWNVNNHDYHRESIAEHVIGTIILAKVFNEEFHLNIDINKVIRMLLLHETEEIIIGDITEFDGISPSEKMRMGHEAIEKLLDNFPHKERILDLIYEFDNRETDDARFAYLCDKFECDLQAERYERLGLNSLSNQENNHSFHDERVQQIIKDGAKDVAMIFHVFDLSKIKDNEPFKSGMEYIMRRN